MSGFMKVAIKIVLTCNKIEREKMSDQCKLYTDGGVYGTVKVNTIKFVPR